MIMTSEWLTALETTDELSAMIINSELAIALQQAQQAVYNDKTTAQEIREFQRMKEHYEDVQRFGKYHPDYNVIMKKIRVQKRKLDLNEKVSALKIAENDFQDMLDDISLIFAGTVSQAVQVPVSNLSKQKATSSCSTGGCGSGGSCGCAG